MNELSSECSVLSKEPFACDQQIGTNALSSLNEPFACDQHIRTKFMNALSSSNIRLRAILLHTVYVHVKHRGIARVTVFCYRAKICLLDFRSIATREGVPWVNEFFHPCFFYPLDKTFDSECYYWKSSE